MSGSAPTLRYRVAGGAGTLRPAAGRAADAARGLGVEVARAADVELAVHELLANALEHGHLGDPSLQTIVEIDVGGIVEIDGSRREVVAIRVTDAALGGGFPAEPDRRKGTAGHRGRGLIIAASVADRVTFDTREGSTTVALELRRGA